MANRSLLLLWWGTHKKKLSSLQPSVSVYILYSTCRVGESYLGVKHPVCVVSVGGALVEAVVASSGVVQIAVAPSQREGREETQQLQNQRHCQLPFLFFFLVAKRYPHTHFFLFSRE